jgi:hypothetical protein
MASFSRVPKVGPQSSSQVTSVPRPREDLSQAEFSQKDLDSTGRVRVTRRTRVESVSVLPPKEAPSGKPSFRLFLELDPNLNPSSQFRRTGTAFGIELESDERDLSSVVRLSGRMILIHYLLWTEDVSTNDLLVRIKGLTEENSNLQRKLSAAQDQLQFVLESQRGLPED